MLTVVIAERKHLDSIQRYDLFLHPILKQAKVSFCEWDPTALRYEEAVPELNDIVSREKQWRAVVVCNDQNTESKNPFDRVSFSPPEPEYSETSELRTVLSEGYYNRLYAAKSAAYRKAAEQPLTRLMTWLCQQPITQDDATDMSALDGDFKEYSLETKEKKRLRQQILKDTEMTIVLPREIYCIARRHYQEQEREIRSSWMSHTDFHYSRFYDRNLYFDRMRYLVCDCVKEKHREYEYDYLRFLYGVLLFACNEVPNGCMKPNLVYCLNCENDEEAFRRIVVTYDEKLKATQEALEIQINRFRTAKTEQMTDVEASAFSSMVTIPVTIDVGFDESEMFADKEVYGLAYDSPDREDVVWERDYQLSLKTLHRFLKQPRRSLKKSVGLLHQMSHADLSRVPLMQEFQAEDLREYVNIAERRMLSVRSPELKTAGEYFYMAGEGDEDVQSVLCTRMTKKTTVGLFAAVIVMFLVCFVPLFFTNRGNTATFAFSLILTGCALVLAAAVGLVCLFLLRKELKDRVDDYNGIVGDIQNDVYAKMNSASKYLGYACNVMRGVHVLQYYDTHPDERSIQINIRNKHINDIQRYRAELDEMLGMFLSDRAVADAPMAEPYERDFARLIDMKYPIPFSDANSRVIDFLQKGNEILIPVDFVKNISIRLEELYD